MRNRSWFPGPQSVVCGMYLRTFPRPNERRASTIPLVSSDVDCERDGVVSQTVGKMLCRIGASGHFIRLFSPPFFGECVACSTRVERHPSCVPTAHVMEWRSAERMKQGVCCSQGFSPRVDLEEGAAVAHAYAAVCYRMRLTMQRTCFLADCTSTSYG